MPDVEYCYYDCWESRFVLYFFSLSSFACIASIPFAFHRPPFESKLTASPEDVQPYVTLAQRLQRDKHRVRLASHGTFRSFVEDAAVEFFDIGGDPAAVMGYMVKSAYGCLILARSSPHDISRPCVNAYDE